MDDTPRRPWYELDLPKVLVFCVFVAAIEGFAAITYYRQQVALIPSPGRAATTRIPHAPDPEPRPEDDRCKFRDAEVEMDSRWSN